MNNFFLLNEAIDIRDFDTFKSGLSNLVAISKVKGDVFRKHESVYDLQSYTQLFSNYGQVEQAISQFLEQLSPCEEYIKDEAMAEMHFTNDNNAFLGIDFHTLNILEKKQITDDNTYKIYKISLLSFFDKLLNDLGTCAYSSSFEKEFTSLDDTVKISIISEFKKAKDRRLVTPYFPDTKIIKDVSPNNYRCKVYELRVYRPIALRVYFNESPERICLGSIEQKSNPNQTEDIKTAHKILSSL